MFSKSLEKYVNSLKQKKHRLKHQCFLAEGEKISEEILQSPLQVEQIFALREWIENHQLILKGQRATIIEVNGKEMKRISALKEPSEVLLVIRIPDYAIDDKSVTDDLNLVLENIQDPGNMGTIIRIADWFAIPNIFCSEDCVDVYNPKVVQATMGSLSRVKIFEMNLQKLFNRFHSISVYATALDGENIFGMKLEDYGFIIIGNEGKGISSSLEKFIHHKLSIPKYGKAESLNAAVAAGIVCAEFRKPNNLRPI